MATISSAADEGMDATRQLSIDPRRAIPRFLVATAAAVLAAALLGDHPWVFRAVGGWDAFSLTELALAWSIIAPSRAGQSRPWLEAKETGRRLTATFLLVACPVGLFLAFYLLRGARTFAPGHRAPAVLLGLAAVVSTWLVTHTTYTAVYARLYQGEGGLQFPREQAPEYWDLAYFAFTLGMCFQVSDVAVVTHRMRRIVLGHALLSFLYNTAILALAMNLVAGLWG